MLASESDSTQKLRKKFEERLAKDEQHVNPAATTKKAEEIRRQIAKAAGWREVVTEKRFDVFDENTHPAEVSTTTARKVQQVMKLYNLAQQETKS